MHSVCTDTNLALPVELTGELPAWPESTETFRNCSTSSGVTACLKNFTGAIGYIDSGHGIDAGLAEVRLPRKDNINEFFHSREGTPIADAIATVTLPNNATDSFANVTYLNAGDGKTWPLILMTYLYVRTDLSYIDNVLEQSLVVAFLRTFFNTDYITPCTKLFGFTAMNDIPTMKKYSEAAIALVNALVSSNSSTWTFESKTEKIVGGGLYVLSSKRKEIIDANLQDLTTAVDQLEVEVSAFMSDGTLGTGSMARLVALEQKVEQIILDMNGIQSQVTSADISKSSSNNKVWNSQDATQLKAALVLSSLSFVFWCFWIGTYAMRYMNSS
jgi:hypothetical protein